MLSGLATESKIGENDLTAVKRLYKFLFFYAHKPVDDQKSAITKFAVSKDIAKAINTQLDNPAKDNEQSMTIPDSWLNGLPEAIKAHIRQYGIVIKYHAKGYQEQPSTQDFIDRANSIVDAWAYIANQLKAAEKLKAKITIEIKKHFDLVDAYTKQDLDEAKFKAIRDSFEKYLAEKVIPELVKLIPNERKLLLSAHINRKDIPSDAKSNLHYVRAFAQLAQQRLADPVTILRQAEIEINSMGRPALIHVDPSGQFTSELPNMLNNYGEAETWSCYKRNFDNVERAIPANSVWRLGGTVDLDKSFDVEILQENEFETSASDVVVDAPNLLEVIEKTMAVVQARLRSLADKHLALRYQSNPGIGKSKENPIDIHIDQISLLSMVTEFLGINLEKRWDEEARQHVQVMLLFHIFNMFNANGVLKETLKYHDADGKPVAKNIFIRPHFNFCSFGTNKGRNAVDPWQYVINALFANKHFQATQENLLSKVNDSKGPASTKLKNLLSILCEDEELQKQRHAAESAWAENPGLIYYSFINRNLRDRNYSQSTKLGEDLQDIEITVLNFYNTTGAKLYKKEKALWSQQRIAFKEVLKELESELTEKPALQAIYNQALDLFTTRELFYRRNTTSWTKKVYNFASQATGTDANYQLQLAILRNSKRCGHESKGHCNDSTDRTGALKVKEKANQIYRRRYGRLPKFWHKKDMYALRQIETRQQNIDASLSNSRFSVPGAVGHEIHKEDGHSHLSSVLKYMRQLAKGPYKKASAFIRKQKAKEVAKTAPASKRGILTTFIVSFLFAATTGFAANNSSPSSQDVVIAGTAAPIPISQQSQNRDDPTPLTKKEDRTGKAGQTDEDNDLMLAATKDPNDGTANKRDGDSPTPTTDREDRLVAQLRKLQGELRSVDVDASGDTSFDNLTDSDSEADLTDTELEPSSAFDEEAEPIPDTPQLDTPPLKETFLLDLDEFMYKMRTSKAYTDVHPQKQATSHEKPYQQKFSFSRAIAKDLGFDIELDHPTETPSPSRHRIALKC